MIWEYFCGNIMLTINFILSGENVCILMTWLPVLVIFIGQFLYLHTVFTVFRLLTDFVCLYTYEFWLSLCKIVRSSVILLLFLFIFSWSICNMREEPRVKYQNITSMSSNFSYCTTLLQDASIIHINWKPEFKKHIWLPNATVFFSFII